MKNLFLQFIHWITKIWLIIFVLALIVIAILYQGESHPAFFNSHNFTFYIAGVKIPIWFLIKGFIAIITILSVASLALEKLEVKIHNLSYLPKRRKNLIIKVTQIVVYILVFILGLDILHLDLTTFTVFSGAVGVGLGIGLQSVAANFISGMILSSEKSIESDDLIELADGTLGNVRYTGARYVLVTTVTGAEIIIPNEYLITNQIKNWTYSDRVAALRVHISIAYDNDINFAMQLMQQATERHNDILSDPAPSVHIDNIYYDTVNLEVMFFIDDITIKRMQAIHSEVLSDICTIFKQHGIQIATFPPSPQNMAV